MRFLSSKAMSHGLQVALVVFGYAVLVRLVLAEVLYLIPREWWAERLAGAPALHVSLLYLVMLLRVEPGVGLTPHVWEVTSAIRELVQASVLFYIIRVLRQIGAALTAEKPFLTENSARVRHVGLAILILAAVNWLITGSAYLTVRALGPQAMLIPALPSLSTALFGVMVLVLGEVFRHGAQLQKDHDLTV